MVKWIIAVLVIVILGASVFTGIHYYKQGKDAADALARSLKRKDISITVVEGKRREEIATELENKGITSAKDFLAASSGVEGTLFPDTYRFFPNTSASDVVSKMQENFNTKTASLNLTRDQLILASIVEREASGDSERATIAGVYNNRLKINMKLEADPTTQYAKDTLAYQANPDSTFQFWGVITVADYQGVHSPFNTYTVEGLPPGPICNPGIKSIEAAINPETNPYYYFVHKNGQLLLAKTLAQHNQQVNGK